ncbi:MAG: aminotransferase class V-fold PLP-dependent enzyme [Saprospiraceae bacterium]
MNQAIQPATTRTSSEPDSRLEAYFHRFRAHTIGIDQRYPTPYGDVNMIYADWTASGRLYQPIEDRIAHDLGPYLGNTHTETTITGSSMTKAYHAARMLIKKHVGALPEDILIPTGSGMTGAVNKFQRILGFKVHERYRDQIRIPESDRPVVFVTHMEHHSNQTSWLETIAEVILIPHLENGLIDLDGFRKTILQYTHRQVKIAAVTSCSNVTGIRTPYHDIARIMHEHDGLCFVDFACSAPYIDINMRPVDPLEHLDAIYFSPHKFLGGPGTSGILIFKPDLYQNQVPDHPGGGTVKWTNPWGERSYINAIEDREDGGTPPFLQTIRVALAVKLKEEMGVAQIHDRETELIDRLWPRMSAIQGLHILAPEQKERLPVFSFYIEDLHYNLGVKILNDRFGIQVRGGCSCAGTYGHYLLAISYETSKSITDDIEKGILSSKAGWMRLSLHPIMTNEEVDYIAEALSQLAAHHQEWARDYVYIPSTNEFVHLRELPNEDELVEQWMHQPVTPL